MRRSLLSSLLVLPAALVSPVASAADAADAALTATIKSGVETTVVALLELMKK